MSTPVPGNSPPRLDALTGLRGIAAWMVVLFHARALLVDWLPAPVIEAAGYGFLAVDLFFIMSGFVMWLNYGPRLRRDGLRGAPGFWWRRVARIWPLHAAILLAMVGFALLLLVTQRDMAGYPLAQLPLHFALVQNWGLTDSLTWNHPAWSISTEMGAYLFFPFLVLAVRWENLPPAILIACVLVCAGLLYGVFRMAGEPSLGGQIPQLGLMRCVMEFSIGMLIANIWQAWRGKSVACIAMVATAIGVFALMFAGFAPATLALPVAFAAMLLALALDAGPVARLLGAPVLRWLGDASYATYLAHFPLLIVWKLIFVDASLTLSPLSFAGYCAVLLALSAALYRWLEKPAQRVFNRALPLIQPSQQTAR